MHWNPNTSLSRNTENQYGSISAIGSLSPCHSRTQSHPHTLTCFTAWYCLNVSSVQGRASACRPLIVPVSVTILRVYRWKLVSTFCLHTPLDRTAPKLYLHISSTIATKFLLHTGPTTKSVHSLVVANFIPPLRFVFVQA